VSQAAELPRIGERLGGRYRLDAIVARGGVGVVFRAQDLDTERIVAVKVLPLSIDRGNKRERFLREARHAATVGHPHVVKVFDAGFFGDDRPYLVMELLDGASLHHRIQTVGPLKITDVCTVGQQLLSACEAMHAKEIVHRDIKPGNVFLIRALGVTVKLIDLGMSKRLADDLDGNITEPGRVIGTPSYMAPEVLLGNPATPAADIYGVGATLFEALVGVPIVKRSRRVEETFSAVLKRDNLPPSQLRPKIPPYVDALVVKALHRDPADRWADAAAMKAACDEALNSAVRDGIP